MIADVDILSMIVLSEPDLEEIYFFPVDDRTLKLVVMLSKLKRSVKGESLFIFYLLK